MPTLYLEPGYVKFRAPKSDNLSFDMRPPEIRFGCRCEASTHKRWGSHPYEISDIPQCSGVRVQAHTERERPHARVWRADIK
jgi:hypothetical protein